MSAEHDPPDPRVTRTVCPRCQGQGASITPVAAADGTRMVARPCPTCEATGRLSGFSVPT